MTAFVALLRGINVGGATTLAMADLRRIAAEAGLANVRTHIASGNLLFESDLGEPALKRMIEERLEALTGRRIPVCLRSAAEMAAVAAANPFADRPGNRTVGDLPRRAAARRCRGNGEGRGRGADRAGRARDLRLLSRRSGAVEAADPGGAGGDGAEHEYGGEADGDAARVRQQPIRPGTCRGGNPPKGGGGLPAESKTPPLRGPPPHERVGRRFAALRLIWLLPPPCRLCYPFFARPETRRGGEGRWRTRFSSPAR